MKNGNMRLQILACEYMERVYGKEWEDRLTLSSPAITSAFIDGYKVKENEEKTATTLVYNRKMVDIMEPQRENIEQILKLKVKVQDYMPKNLIALCDDNMNVLAFIDLNKKG